jgi:hypothetical protein
MKKLTRLISILVCSAMFMFHIAGAQTSPQGPGKTDNANPIHRSCGMDAHMETLLQNPAYRKVHEQKLERMKNMPQERSSCGTPASLPVAVHYQNVSNPNIPCLIQLAEEQIDILNADINGTNSDISLWTNSASSFFPGVANGETCVSFCLATRNHPAGFGLSDGDPAITINQTTGDFNAAWAGYINIYVRGGGGGLLGYSPLGGDGDGDGVVVFLEGWGTGSGCYPGLPVSAYNLGRTLTHEIGHYLLLDHIFSGGCNNWDDVDDTPAEASAYFGCPALGAATCGSNDMHMNFMDYTNDACMYMFSAGQSSRMENYLNANLQNVIENAANVCSPPCNTPTITPPTITQPTCALPTGAIAVNATSSEAIEYSVDNGMDWQSSPTFSGLTPGAYYIKVRLEASPACETAYSGNPVTLISPFTASTTADTWTGCVSTDWATPGNWADGSVPTAADNATIPDVANDPVISTAAIARSINVLANGSLTISSTGTLTINSDASPLFTNSGTVVNEGTVSLNTSTGVKFHRLLNQASGTFTNKNALHIGNTSGSNYSIRSIFNRGQFVNMAGAIDISSTNRAIYLESGATFTNNASIVFNTGLFNIDSSAIYAPTGTTFNNTPCSATLLATAGPSNLGRFQTFGGAFNNAGLITENSSGFSSISTNTGIVQNLGGGSFSIGSNTGILTTDPAPQNPCCAAPQAICTSYTAVLGPNGMATLTTANVDGGSTAGCGLQGISVLPNTFNCSHVGPQTVTLTITDLNGASASCQTTVTVQDNTPPTISCPGSQTLVLGPNGTASLPDYTGMATTGDNCGVDGVTQSPVAGTTVSGAGPMTVTLTVTDSNGLTNDCSFTVIKTGDDDCDGVNNEDDICPGGDDSVDNNGDGIPDCSQSLPYEQYHADWKCGNDKLIVCHVDEDGNRFNLCISQSAAPAHMGHGDWAGPCIGCAEERSTSGGAGRVVVEGLEMALFPNPTDGTVMVQLNGLFEGEAQLTVLDPLGRVALVQKIGEGTELLQLDFSGKAFASGEYLVRVVTNSDVLISKLMISK